MTKIAISPNVNGTGTFTLAAPDSNTNRTLTLPDEEGTVATIENIPPGYEDQDALDLFNVSGSAPVFACRAWVSFDGTDPEAIRASGNVSSITDNGVGNYTVNFTTNMPDANYSASGQAGFFTGGTSGNTQNAFLSSYNHSTSSFRFAVFNTAAQNVDRPMVSVSIVR